MDNQIQQIELFHLNDQHHALSVCRGLLHEELHSMLVGARYHKDFEVQLPAAKIERIVAQVCGDGPLTKTQFFPSQLTTGELAVPGRVGIQPSLPRCAPTQISPRW
jgi:hypothetical protein